MHCITSSNKFLIEDPVEQCLKRVLYMGRVIGLIPLSFQLKPSITVNFRWFSPAALHTMILALITLMLSLSSLSITLEKIGKLPSIMEELVNLEELSCWMSFNFVYFYFWKNARHLLHMLEKWPATMNWLDLSSTDKKFPKFCILLTILVLGVGLTENTLCDMHPSRIMFDGQPLLQRLIDASGANLHFQTFPTAIMTTVVYAVGIYTIKMGTFAWNFGDIFLITVCRALSYKFKQINWQIQMFILEKEQSGKSVGGIESGYFLVHNMQSKWLPQRRKSFQSWTEIREKLLGLCKLTNQWTSFISPLVLVCYGCNLHLIIQRIFLLLYDSNTSNNDTLLGSMYAYASGLQFTLRVILVTFYASQVYHSTEEIVTTLEETSDVVFSETACRTEKLLDCHPVGVTIFGAFKITRNFFISIVSFIFTAEIVLLQAMHATRVK